MDRGGKILVGWFCVYVLVSLFIVIGIPLICIFTASHQPKNPVISVESSSVKAYNLTSDHRLFCIVNLNVRVYNPNTKKRIFRFNGVRIEVRKGKHHTLAKDALGDFTLGPNGEVVIYVEAVGLYVEVERKIAGELAADVVVGEGRVNAFIAGDVGSYSLEVECKNVVVDFSRSTVRFQRVECKASLIDGGGI